MESRSAQDCLAQAAQLIQRLERISADSVWAHRSSGYRGSLLKWISRAERSISTGTPLAQADYTRYDLLLETGLRMLASAAQENIRKRSFKR